MGGPKGELMDGPHSLQFGLGWARSGPRASSFLETPSNMCGICNITVDAEFLVI